MLVLPILAANYRWTRIVLGVLATLALCQAGGVANASTPAAPTTYVVEELSNSLGNAFSLVVLEGAATKAVIKIGSANPNQYLCGWNVSTTGAAFLLLNPISASQAYGTIYVVTFANPLSASKAYSLVDQYYPGAISSAQLPLFKCKVQVSANVVPVPFWTMLPQSNAGPLSSEQFEFVASVPNRLIYASPRFLPETKDAWAIVGGTNLYYQNGPSLYTVAIPADGLPSFAPQPPYASVPNGSQAVGLKVVLPSAR